MRFYQGRRTAGRDATESPSDLRSRFGHSLRVEVVNTPTASSSVANRSNSIAVPVISVSDKSSLRARPCSTMKIIRISCTFIADVYFACAKRSYPSISLYLVTISLF